MATSVFSVGESSKVLTYIGQGLLTDTSATTICQTASSGIFILTAKSGTDATTSVAITVDGQTIATQLYNNSALMNNFHDLRPFVAATTYNNTSTGTTFGNVYHTVLRFPFGHSLDVSVSNNGNAWSYALYLYV